MAKSDKFICPIFWKELITSCADLTDQEFGSFVRLLLYQWDRQMLPSDLKKLRLLSESIEQTATSILPKFKTLTNGFIQNAYMEEIRREREDFRNKRSVAGKKGMENRYNKPANKRSNKKITKEVEVKGEVEVGNEIKNTIDNGFEIFWNSYEKKVDRGACLKKWGSLTDADREAIMNHVSDYVKSTPDKQFRKDPETYLNNRSWENEIIVKKSNNGSFNSKEELIAGRVTASGAAEFLGGRPN